MGFLKGKKILISGISSQYSIAFGIARAMYEQEAELGFICQNNKISNKIKKLVKNMTSDLILSCDVSNDNDIKKLFVNVKKIWNKFDGLIHSIAYCPREQLCEDFIQTTTRKTFNTTHEISSYSFLALIKECRNMLNSDSSILTLSSIGSQHVIPNYNLMGLAKASLEANVRYMASILGQYNIRVNAISAGPIKTASACGIKHFNQFKNYCQSSSFIKKNITSADIGNVAAFLSSNLSNGITGSIIYVDNGFHVSRINSIL